jgi:hypothetical protein
VNSTRIAKAEAAAATIVKFKGQHREHTLVFLIAHNRIQQHERLGHRRAAQSSQREFLEVDSSDDGWGACVYQYEHEHDEDREAGKLSMFSKKPKRIIAWVPKAWANYEKASLPIFYKETIARLLSFEQFRNLIETQQPGHGVTCYSDHLSGIKSTSLSNKGKLSTWRIHETSDLTSMIGTLYKSGPTMSVADPLSRLARQEHNR